MSEWLYSSRNFFPRDVHYGTVKDYVGARNLRRLASNGHPAQRLDPVGEGRVRAKEAHKDLAWA